MHEEIFLRKVNGHYCDDYQEKCHRFWLRLRHTVILISNVRTSASKKINLMAIIRTLTISNTTFERMKEKFEGFQQTVLHMERFRCYCSVSGLSIRHHHITRRVPVLGSFGLLEGQLTDKSMCAFFQLYRDALSMD